MPKQSEKKEKFTVKGQLEVITEQVSFFSTVTEYAEYKLSVK
jgi:hypothetical protein